MEPSPKHSRTTEAESFEKSTRSHLWPSTRCRNSCQSSDDAQAECNQPDRRLTARASIQAGRPRVQNPQCSLEPFVLFPSHLVPLSILISASRCSAGLEKLSCPPVSTKIAYHGPRALSFSRKLQRIQRLRHQAPSTRHLRRVQAPVPSRQPSSTSGRVSKTLRGPPGFIIRRPPDASFSLRRSHPPAERGLRMVAGR